MKTIKVILVGYGYWGPNLARNVLLNPSYELVGVVETDPERRKKAQDTLRVHCFESFTELSEKESIDLVIIATRPASHLMIATHFINLGCHLILTKPCCISKAEAEILFSLARKAGVKVFIDYTYLYSPLIRHLKTSSACQEIIEQSRNYISYRTSLGIIQSDVDVVIDLAVHDLSILLYLKESLPIRVQCLPIGGFSLSKVLNAVVLLEWSDGFTAFIHVSWLSPIKIRSITISSPVSSIFINETNAKNPIEVFEISPSFSDLTHLSLSQSIKRNISYTVGNSISPLIDLFEPLSKLLEDVADALRGKNLDFNIPSEEFTLGIWKIVESLEKSLEIGGLEVAIEQ